MILIRQILKNWYIADVGVDDWNHLVEVVHQQSDHDEDDDDDDDDDDEGERRDEDGYDNDDVVGIPCDNQY